MQGTSAQRDKLVRVSIKAKTACITMHAHGKPSLKMHQHMVVVFGDKSSELGETHEHNMKFHS